MVVIPWVARMRSRWVAVAVATLLGSVAVSDTPDFPELTELMTPEEYAAAGLDKLDAREREALREWLVRYTARDAGRVERTSKRVKRLKARVLELTLDGEFSGWSGRTVFRFTNGEVWRQIGNEHYYPRRKIPNPAMTIHRGLIGGYQLELVETGARVKVERIK